MMKEKPTFTLQLRLSKIMKLATWLQTSMLAVFLSLDPSGALAAAGSVDLGTVIIGTMRCSPVSWTNQSPGNGISCSGSPPSCSFNFPEPARLVIFTPSAISSVTPAQATAPGTSLVTSSGGTTATFGSVTVQYCVTPNVIQVGDQIVANFSPALSNNSTSEVIPISFKAVPAAVIGEPLLSTLSFNPFVGQLLTKSFSVSNYTAAPVTITGVSTGNIAINISGSSPVGLTIAPNGGSTTIALQALSNQVQSYSGNTQVSTTGGIASYPYSVFSSLISISTGSDANGTISSGTTATYGQSLTITLAASSGYKLDKLIDSGQDVTLSATPSIVGGNYSYRYALNSVTTNHSIYASYTVNTSPPTIAQVPALPIAAELILGLGIGGLAAWKATRRKRSD